ncbi:MAG: hypothetical protein CHACPFDD_01890 [Phycisphaerae bacterium]|nr:hypothetical protein [Phycisphaerae bacterium]
MSESRGDTRTVMIDTLARRAARDLLFAATAVGVAAVAMAFTVAVLGFDPLRLGPAFLDGALGNAYRLGSTLALACPLCLLGVACALAFRGGVLNIGAEGQYLIGALTAAAVGPRLAGLEPWVGVAVLLAAGVLGGAAWALLAALLKLGRGVPEVLSTILLNFVALRLLEFIVRGPLVDEQSIDRESTAAIASAAILPQVWTAGGLHAGVLIALGAAVLLQFVVSRSTFGFRLRALGANPIASRYAGISTASLTAMLMGLSGGLAGLAGAVEISGTHHYLTTSFAAGYGYTAIAVALLARLAPFGVVPAALFFAAIETGTRGMQKLPEQAMQSFPTVMKFVAQGVVVLVIVLLTRPRTPLGTPDD